MERDLISEFNLKIKGRTQDQIAGGDIMTGEIDNPSLSVLPRSESVLYTIGRIIVGICAGVSWNQKIRLHNTNICISIYHASHNQYSVETFCSPG